MSNAHWFDDWRDKWLPRGPGDAPGGEVDPPPDPPDGDTFSETRAVRLAPAALTDTVATALVLPFDLTDAILATTANGGESLQDGLDIRFELSDTTLVPHVLRSYSATTGRITGWLRLPAGQGTSGLEFNLLVGNGIVDPQPFPTGTWSGYSFVNLSDGSDDVAGRDLTLQSGVSAGDHLDSIDFDGSGGLAVVTNSDFLDGVATETWIVWVDGDASMANTSRGFIVEGNLAEFGQSGRLWRNRPASEDSLFIGGWRTGGWTDWKGPVGSSINGPQTVIANYNATTPIDVMIEGVTVAPVSSTTSTGNLRTWGDDFALGRGSTETAGSQSWLGSVMVQVRVDWPCLEPEALLLARMLYSANPWQVIQIADALGDFEALAEPPIVISEEPGGGETETPDELPTPIRTVHVTNASQLTAALADAQAGDEIVLADGSYGGGFTISGKNGTADNPIVIRAENLLDASLGGEVNTCLTISGGSHVWVHGLNFTGYILNGVYFSGQRHKVLRCRFTDYGRSTYFTRSHGVTSNERTDFCEIAFCLFESPRALSAWTPADGQWPQWRWGWRGGYQASTASYDLTITRCHFRNFPPSSDPDYRSDQSEGIEVAATGLFTPTRMTISYCLFESLPWNQGACIDAKGGDQGIIEYCTFVTSNMRAIDLRQCRQWTVQHNWAENTTGISVYGPDHTLIGNRIVGTGSILLLRGNGDESIYGNARVSNCLLRCNVGSLRIGLDYSSSGTSYLPTGVKVDGHSGTISIQPGSGVTQNAGYSCATNQAFKLAAAEVGPEAGPLASEMFLNPFNAESAYHRPLGSNLTVGSTGDAIYDWWQTNKTTIAAGFFVNWRGVSGCKTLYPTTSDAEVTVLQRDYNDAPISGTWQIGATIKIPASNDVLNAPLATADKRDNVVVVFIPGTYTAVEFYRMWRSGSTYRAAIARVVDLAGTGHPTTLGQRIGVSASGWTIFAGALSAAELAAGVPQHAHTFGISGLGDPFMALDNTIQWPSGNADGFASSPSNNTGVIPYGQAFMLPSSVNIAGLGLSTTEGANFAECHKIYPWYAIDDSFGMTMRAVDNPINSTAIRNDLRLIVPHIVPVTNAVTGATAQMVQNGSGTQTGSIGTPGAAFTGTLLGANSALI